LRLCDLGFDSRGFFFDLRFNLGFRFRFNAGRRCFDMSRLGRRFRNLDIRYLDGHDIVVTGGNHFVAVRDIDTKVATQLVGYAILDCVGMRCHRHAQVLQFANDLGVIAIELAG
jgi:hypothetical protein